MGKNDKILTKQDFRAIANTLEYCFSEYCHPTEDGELYGIFVGGSESMMTHENVNRRASSDVDITLSHPWSHYTLIESLVNEGYVKQPRTVHDRGYTSLNGFQGEHNPLNMDIFYGDRVFNFPREWIVNNSQPLEIDGTHYDHLSILRPEAATVRKFTRFAEGEEAQSHDIQHLLDRTDNMEKTEREAYWQRLDQCTQDLLDVSFNELRSHVQHRLVTNGR